MLNRDILSAKMFRYLLLEIVKAEDFAILRSFYLPYAIPSEDSNMSRVAQIAFLGI